MFNTRKAFFIYFAVFACSFDQRESRKIAIKMNREKENDEGSRLRHAFHLNKLLLFIVLLLFCNAIYIQIDRKVSWAQGVHNAIVCTTHISLCSKRKHHFFFAVAFLLTHVFWRVSVCARWVLSSFFFAASKSPSLRHLHFLVFVWTFFFFCFSFPFGNCVCKHMQRTTQPIYNC